MKTRCFWLCILTHHLVHTNIIHLSSYSFLITFLILSFGFLTGLFKFLLSPLFVFKKCCFESRWKICYFLVRSDEISSHYLPLIGEGRDITAYLPFCKWSRGLLEPIPVISLGEGRVHPDESPSYWRVCCSEWCSLFIPHVFTTSMSQVQIAQYFCYSSLRINRRILTCMLWNHCLNQ